MTKSEQFKAGQLAIEYRKEDHEKIDEYLKASELGLLLFKYYIFYNDGTTQYFKGIETTNLPTCFIDEILNEGVEKVEVVPSDTKLTEAIEILERRIERMNIELIVLRDCIDVLKRIEYSN